MDSEENVDRRFQLRKGDNLLNGLSNGMVTNSIYDKVPRMGMLYGSTWDTLVSLIQTGNFGASSTVNSNFSVVMENQAVNFPSESALVDMTPKLPSSGSGSFSEIVGSYRCGQVTETGCLPNYAGTKRGLTNAAESQENWQNSEDGAVGVSPDGKRKRKASMGASTKLTEVELQKDPSGETCEFPKEDNDNKQKFEQNVAPNLWNKQAAKQAKDNSMLSEPSKENYIHVRAKRGHATNSHSLAERVRRERISERMRLLQELVPGCNKITGKAVMLDEIINYVQSLQQQVEFLSMKLATVNPELDTDIKHILSKDILNFRGSNPAAIGIGSGMTSSHPYPGFSPGTFPGVPGATPLYHPLPQTLWSSDFQSILQMGFDANASITNFEPNGLSKIRIHSDA